MFDLRKIVLSAFIMCNTTLFAGTMGSVCVPGDVTVPCAQRSWEIGGKALYLQTSYNKAFSFIHNPVDVNEYTDLAGRWNWGFQLEASYYFNMGNDINISWYHLDTKAQRFQGSVQESAFTLLTFTAKDQWDAVNGELGQFVDFSAHKKMRFHGGFHYAHIKPSLTVASQTVRYSLNSQYNGFGPRSGIDMNYMLGNGLSIYAKTAAAILVGTTRFDLAVNRITTLPRHGSSTAIIPELEAKLGANYTYSLPQGNLMFDAGYMWFNYFNAFSNVSVINLSRAIGHSDFGASGPYAGLKYRGMI